MMKMVKGKVKNANLIKKKVNNPTIDSEIIWYVYMVKCADDTLYTGITTDLERRVKEHNEDNKLGAKYTKPRRPVKLVYSEKYDSRGVACKREVELKKFGKVEKIQLFARQK